MATRLRSLLGLLTFLCASVAAAATTPAGDAKALIAEGVRLHDAGKYDEAIEKYRAALAVEPGNLEAIYEIGFAYFASGDYQRCLDELEPFLERSGRYKPLYYASLGNCSDMAGKPKKAMRWYEKGLGEFPNDAVLAFNAGVTQMKLEEWGEARRLLKLAISSNPLHRSAHLNLSLAFAAGGYRIPAILALLRFLSLETEGPRAEEAAGRLLALLGAGVTKTGESEYTIQFDADLPKDEGDYAAAELVRSLGGAVVETIEWDGKAEGDKIFYRLDSLLASIDEDKGGKKDFARETYLPFVHELREAGLFEAFAYRFLAPVGPPDMKEWLDRNPTKLALLDGFLASQARR